MAAIDAAVTFDATGQPLGGLAEGAQSGILVFDVARVTNPVQYAALLHPTPMLLLSTAVFRVG